MLREDWHWVCNQMQVVCRLLRSSAKPLPATLLGAGALSRRCSLTYRSSRPAR